MKFQKTEKLILYFYALQLKSNPHQVDNTL